MNKNALLVSFLLIFFAVSCQKKHCWKCVSYGISRNALHDTTAPKDEHIECNMTKKEVRAYENAQSHPVYYTNGTIQDNTTNCSEE